MDQATESLRRYPVEVSGWDKEETFFVEHARLEWNEQSQKRVVLRHALRTGAVVFLRLLEAVNPPAALPVAFRAGRIQPAAEPDCSEVYLNQIWPEPRGAGSTRGGAGTSAATTAFHQRFHLESIIRESFTALSGRSGRPHAALPDTPRPHRR